MGIQNVFRLKAPLPYHGYPTALTYLQVSVYHIILMEVLCNIVQSSTLHLYSSNTVYMLEIKTGIKFDLQMLYGKFKSDE